MFRRLIAPLIVVAFSSPALGAQSEICKELTSGGIFNASDLQHDTDRYSFLKDEFCDTYNSQSARGSSNELGAGGSYGLYKGSFNKSEIISSNEELFKQVCRSSAGEFQMNNSLRSSVRQASRDLATMFVDCVKSTSTGFHAYFTAQNYSSFTIHLYNNANADSALDVQRVYFSPSSAVEKCNPPEALGASVDHPYKTRDQTYFSINCDKNPDQAVFVHLLIAQAGEEVEGLLPGVNDKLGDMEDRLNQMGAALDEALERATRVETGMLQCPGGSFPMTLGWQDRASWPLQFYPPFRETPSVSASISQMEAYSTLRVEPGTDYIPSLDAYAIDVVDVTPVGAKLTLRAAGYTSSLSHCRVQWTAVGR